MDPDGELIVVQGQLHFYRLFRSTGRMERVSDNAVLDLNWPAIPDQFRLVLHRVMRFAGASGATCSPTHARFHLRRLFRSQKGVKKKRSD